MRDFQSLVGHLFIAIEQNVQVNVSRALVDDLLPPHISLNCLQLIKKGKRLKFSLNLHIHQHFVQFKNLTDLLRKPH